MRTLVRLQPAQAPPSTEQLLLYTCIHATRSFLVCGANSGAVHVYARDSVAGPEGAAAWGLVVPESLRLRKVFQPPPRAPAAVTAVCLCPARDLIAVGLADGTVHVSTASLYQSASSSVVGPAAPVPKAAFGPLGLGAFGFKRASDAATTAAVAAAATAARGVNHTHVEHRGAAVTQLLWDTDGSRLFSACERGLVVLLRLPMLPQAQVGVGRGGGGGDGGGGSSDIGGGVGGTGVGAGTGSGIRNQGDAGSVVVTPAAIIRSGARTAVKDPFQQVTALLSPLVAAVPRIAAAGTAGSSLQEPETAMVLRESCPVVQMDWGATVVRPLDAVATAARRGGAARCNVLLVVSQQRARLVYFPMGGSSSAPFISTIDLSDAPLTGDASAHQYGGCLWAPDLTPPELEDVAISPAGSESPERLAPSAAEQPRLPLQPIRGMRRAAPSGTASGAKLVTVALLARPGGRLWSITLLDGELAAAYEPKWPENSDAGGGGGATAGDRMATATPLRPVELGRLRLVSPGWSMAPLVLSWSSGGLPPWRRPTPAVPPPPGAADPAKIAVPEETAPAASFLLDPSANSIVAVAGAPSGGGISAVAGTEMSVPEPLPLASAQGTQQPADLCGGGDEGDARCDVLYALHGASISCFLLEDERPNPADTVGHLRAAASAAFVAVGSFDGAVGSFGTAGCGSGIAGSAAGGAGTASSDAEIAGGGLATSRSDGEEAGGFRFASLKLSSLDALEGAESALGELEELSVAVGNGSGSGGDSADRIEGNDASRGAATTAEARRCSRRPRRTGSEAGASAGAGAGSDSDDDGSSREGDDGASAAFGGRLPNRRRRKSGRPSAGAPFPQLPWRASSGSGGSFGGAGAADTANSRRRSTGEIMDVGRTTMGGAGSGSSAGWGGGDDGGDGDDGSGGSRRGRGRESLRPSLVLETEELLALSSSILDGC
ncbi:unnamed protein product, partial [Phaeothamnion confervicola]